MTSKRILVVDDEADLAELLAFNLRQGGFVVDIAYDGASTQAALAADMPDLVVLDVMLPDTSGIEICRRLRKNPKTEHLPIVMVTARGDEVDRVVGFELGADDYIVKPFSPRELVLRIQAVLRRSLRPLARPDADAAEPGAYLHFGVLSIDVARHRVTVEGAPVALTALEFRLLLDLAERRVMKQYDMGSDNPSKQEHFFRSRFSFAGLF
ncbi:MAG: response regulator [Polyangiales bacterium]